MNSAHYFSGGRRFGHARTTAGTGMIFLLAAAGILLSWGLGFCQESPAAIGFFKEVKEPAAIDRQGATISARAGNPVFTHDLLKTGKNGGLGITFTDDTMISIGPDTEYAIDSFIFHPEKKELSFISRIKYGTLQFISGTIAKLAPEKVSIQTPLGTIGVRGTRFLVKIDGN